MKNSRKTPPLRRFFGLLKADRQDVISIYIYALFNGAVALSLPLGIQAIINLLGAGEISTSWIILVFFVIAGIAITGVLQILQLSVSENIRQKIFTRSAFEFAYRIPRIKLEAIDSYYAPELVNRFFDTLSVQKNLSKILLDFSTSSLQIFFGLVLLSFYHPFFIIFGLLLVLMVLFIFWLIGPIGLRTSLKESYYKYEVAHWLEELARTIGTFKLAGETNLPLTKTDDVVEEYLKSRKNHFRTLLWQYIQMTGFRVLVAAGFLIMGGILVINQQMNIGQFVASEIIIILIISSVEKLIISLESVYDLLTALEKLGNVTDLALEKRDGESIDVSNGFHITLDQLSYKFPTSNEDILKGISLELKPNENVCITGFTGAGKSLLLQVIAGLYEDYRGTITYNGVPLSNLNIRQVRRFIGDSLAREDIFKGTITENIGLNKEGIDFEKIKDAACAVGLDKYVNKLPDGYDTVLMPEAQQMPKSIAYKIKLARSIASQPHILLFEDGFHQLQVEDRKNILSYLINKERPWNVIAVSNDEEKVKLFDKVIVLDKGQIVFEGSFDKLKKNTWYNELFKA